MIKPAFLQTLFEESYTQIKEQINQIDHAQSLQTPFEGVNCLHWIVGHVVVSRCNFSMLLDVPSIWDWPTCKLFIPGSTPTSEAQEKIKFTTLLADLDRTQSHLIAALDQVTTADLETTKNNQTIGEHMLEYAVHESFHSGQIELLSRLLKQDY